MRFPFLDAVERLSHALLPFLVREILYTAIVFVVIWSISLIFKKSSPRWHLGLWALVLLRLVLPPDWTHSLSGRNLIGQSEWAGQAWHEVVAWLYPPEEPANTFVLVSPQPILDEGLPIDLAPVPFEEEEPQQNFSVQSILLISWLAGALFFLGFYVRRLSRYYRILRRATDVEHPKIREITFTWRKKMQINRIVRVVSSDNALSPFTLGIFRPVIFLPNTIIGQNDTDLLESVIAHEMAHIRRLDDLWLKLQNLLQVIYFFHPAVWFANSKICLARECLCDSLVLAQNKISPNAYGKSILTILKLNLFGSAAIGLLPGFGSHRQKFRYRILKLKGGHTMKKTQAIFLNMILFAMALFILPMAGQVMIESTANPDSEVVEETGVTEEVVNPDFGLPIQEGVLGCGFDTRRSPCGGPRVEFHKAIDILAPKGTPVFAAANGTVHFANWDTGYGNLIILEHSDKIFTYYGHMDKILVKEKQEVKKGELIGNVGRTGRSVDDNLHFEIREGNKKVNPENYISFEKFKVSKTKEMFVLPIKEGVVTDGFGMRLDKFVDRVKHHNGIDIRSPKGTPVFACQGGVVERVRTNSTTKKGYGNRVEIKHENGFKSLYAHLNEVKVTEGQSVKAGDVIATVGNTGRSTEDHLHFEIHKDKKAVNPEKYISFEKFEASKGVVNPNVTDFVLPIKEGVFSDGFGMREDTTDENRVKMHNGIDVRAPKGTPVFAAAEGTVLSIEPKRGYGNLIIIEHPENIRTNFGRHVSTYYGHLDKIHVKKGQAVKMGELIGEVGSTGKATVAHLHFEVREDSQARNPESYISFHQLKTNYPAKIESEHFELPIKKGFVSNSFGIWKGSYKGGVRIKHDGIDIRSPKGTLIFASKDGIVKSANSKYTINKGYGRKIVLEHKNGFETRYAHLDKIYVKNGQKVKVGDAIGEVGNTGQATGDHLHFEIRKDGQAINPEDYLSFSALEPVEFQEKPALKFNLENPLQAAKVTATFGKQLDPFTKKERFHRGIDFSAKTGTKIFAVDDGKVVLAESDVEIGKGYGKNIILQHSAEFRSRYGQMDSLYVSEGEAVAKGQAIGEVGSTGRSTGPHLHFELIFNGKYINPANHLDLKQMRENLEESEK